MTDKLYFDVTMPTGAVVRIPLSTVDTFVDIRCVLQVEHRDKYGDMYVDHLTLHHDKYGMLSFCDHIAKVFVDADFPVLLVAKPRPHVPGQPNPSTTAHLLPFLQHKQMRWKCS